MLQCRLLIFYYTWKLHLASTPSTREWPLLTGAAERHTQWNERNSTSTLAWQRGAGPWREHEPLGRDGARLEGEGRRRCEQRGRRDQSRRGQWADPGRCEEQWREPAGGGGGDSQHEEGITPPDGVIPLHRLQRHTALSQQTSSSEGAVYVSLSVLLFPRPSFVTIRFSSLGTQPYFVFLTLLASTHSVVFLSVSPSLRSICRYIFANH